MKLQRKSLRLFYCGSDMHTILRDQGSRTVFRGAGQLLAERRRGAVDSLSLLSVNNAGSVVGVARESEGEQFDYTAYGHCSSLASGRSSLGFNGEYYDDFLQGYLLGNGYRLLNGMRFNSPDSFAPFRVLNAYGYCDGDPVNYSDPSGHAPFWLPTRRSYYKMKRVVKEAYKATRIMDKQGRAPLHPSQLPDAVNNGIKKDMRAIQDIGGRLERVDMKEGSSAYRALSRKYNLEKLAADFSHSAEEYKARMHSLMSQHRAEHGPYIKLRAHNDPITRGISALEQEVEVQRRQMQQGSKFDSNLTDAELREVEAWRANKNASYEVRISDLQQEISKLRSKLRQS